MHPGVIDLPVFFSLLKCVGRVDGDAILGVVLSGDPRHVNKPLTDLLESGVGEAVEWAAHE